MKAPITTKLAPTIALFLLAAGCSEGEARRSQSDGSRAASATAVELTGRVTDAAGILTEDDEARLTETIKRLEQATKHQVVVATVPSLQGEDVATYTRNLANSGGIGRKGYDDGVVLLVAPNERKARIAVGYGLEKELPDPLCKQIMDQQIIPRFQEGDLRGGIEAGVNALAAELTN